MKQLYNVAIYSGQALYLPSYPTAYPADAGYNKTQTQLTQMLAPPFSGKIWPKQN
jgi:hypothetical protein